MAKEKYSGVCVGGPYHGRRQAYFAKVMPIAFSFKSGALLDPDVKLDVHYSTYTFDGMKWFFNDPVDAGIAKAMADL